MSYFRSHLQTLEDDLRKVKEGVKQRPDFVQLHWMFFHEIAARVVVQLKARERHTNLGSRLAETFLRKPDTLTTVRALRAYLFRTARNKAWEGLRTAVDTFPITEFVSALKAARCDPAAIAQAKEAAAFFHSLPEREQVILSLREQGLSHADIAKCIGVRDRHTVAKYIADILAKAQRRGHLS